MQRLPSIRDAICNMAEYRCRYRLYGVYDDLVREASVSEGSDCNPIGALGSMFGVPSMYADVRFIFSSRFLETEDLNSSLMLHGAMVRLLDVKNLSRSLAETRKHS